MRRMRYLPLLGLLLATLYLGGCGNVLQPKRMHNPVSLSLKVYYNAGFKDQSLYILVHDENGNLLQTHSIDIGKPSPQTLELTNVPGGGYITGVQVLKEVRSWPTKGNYESLYSTTFAVPIVRRLQDFNLYFAYGTYGSYATGWVGFGYSNSRTSYPRASLAGSCPASAKYLSGYNLEPGGYWWRLAGCNNGAIAEGSAVSSMAQTDGKISFADWAMQGWNDPLKPYAYFYSIDHDPNNALTVTQGDYQSATRTWTLHVTGIPSAYQDFTAYYFVVGVRKGATIAGFSTRNDDPCQGQAPSELCAYATSVDIPGLAESYIARAGLKRTKSGAETYTIIWKPAPSLKSDFSLNYNEFLPPFTGWSISNDLRHITLSGGAAGASQYASLEFWNTSVGRYAYFRTYTLNPAAAKVDLLPLPSSIIGKFNFSKDHYEAWASIWRYDTDYMPPFDVPPLDKQVRVLAIQGGWGATQSLGVPGPSLGNPGIAPAEMHR